MVDFDDYDSDDSEDSEEWQDSWSDYLSHVSVHWLRYIKFKYNEFPVQVEARVSHVCKHYPEIDKAWDLRKMLNSHVYLLHIVEEGKAREKRNKKRSS